MSFQPWSYGWCGQPGGAALAARLPLPLARDLLGAALRNLLSAGAGDAQEDSRGTTKENLDPCMFARPRGYWALGLKLKCWNGDFAKFRKIMRIDGEIWGIWSFCWTRLRLSKSEPELEHGGHVKQRSGVKAKLTPLASSLMQSSIRLISGMSSGLILLGH